MLGLPLDLPLGLCMMLSARPMPSPPWVTSEAALTMGTTCWASCCQQPKFRADASCFSSTLMGIFSREWQGLQMRRCANLVASSRPLTAQSSNFIVSSEHLSVRLSRKRKYDWLWRYLRVYLIFCYSLQEFELLIWGPGFWRLFSLIGFTTSCQLSKDSGPTITLTGSLRAVTAEQRHRARHCIKEGLAFCV